MRYHLEGFCRIFDAFRLNRVWLVSALQRHLWHCSCTPTVQLPGFAILGLQGLLVCGCCCVCLCCLLVACCVGKTCGGRGTTVKW